MSDLIKIPRPQKLSIITLILARLEERAKSGPAEPTLDAFIDEGKEIIAKLGAHVEGAAGSDGSRAALIAASDESDDIVDTWLRKIEAFVGAEALRRTGPNRERAKKLYDAAFPKGRAIVDDRVVEENAQCRDAIEALRAPENAETLVAIELPAGWLDAFEAAVKTSDADYDALAKARGGKSSHVALGRSAELDWEDTLLRLRHYVAGRAKRDEDDKREEGRMLLAPLTDALKQMRAIAAARATRRSKKASEGAAAGGDGAGSDDGDGAPTDGKDAGSDDGGAAARPTPESESPASAGSSE